MGSTHDSEAGNGWLGASSCVMIASQGELGGVFCRLGGDGGKAGMEGFYLCSVVSSLWALSVALRA